MEVGGRNGGLEAAQCHARLKRAWTCTGKAVPLVGDAVDDLLAGEKVTQGQLAGETEDG